MALEYVITYQAYRIGVIFRFKKTVYVRISESCIASEKPSDIKVSVTAYDWFQNVLPVIGTMDISIAKKRSLYITELIKDKQRMITSILEPFRQLWFLVGG